MYPNRVSWGDNTIWHAANDGAGSGLDADLLDGQQGSYYADVLARLGYTPLPASTYTAADVLAKAITVDGAGSGLDADMLDGLHGGDFLRRGAGNRPIDYDNLGGSLTMRADPGGWEMAVRFLAPNGVSFGGFGAAGSGASLSHYFVGPSYGAPNALRVSPDRVSWGENVIWHAANDGAGSGLDADLLDGQQGSYYADVLARLGYTPLPASAYTAADVLAKATTVDGAGSGLDADLLDGYQASDFMLANALGASTFSENGYQILPGGLILQWCTGFQQSNGSEPTQSITFPLTFPNRCLNALVSTNISSAAVSVDTFYQIAGLPSPSGVTVQRQVTAQGADSRPTTPMIFAIGF